MDADDLLCGVVTRNELAHAKENLTITDLVADQDLVVAHPETPIRDAANLMIARDFQQVPVVSPSHPGRLLGWLTLNDIARQQNASGG